MNDCIVSPAPMQTKLFIKSDVNGETSFSKQYSYKYLMRSPTYKMLSPRPYLSYSVSYFSRFQNCYSQENWMYLKNLLRYLKQQKHMDEKLTKSGIVNVELKPLQTI